MKKNYRFLFTIAICFSMLPILKAQEISAPGFYICNEFSCDIENIRSIACASSENPERGVSAEYNGPSGFLGRELSFCWSYQMKTVFFLIRKPEY